MPVFLGYSSFALFSAFVNLVYLFFVIRHLAYLRHYTPPSLRALICYALHFALTRKEQR